MPELEIPAGKLRERLGTYLSHIPQAVNEIATFLECKGETEGNWAIEITGMRLVRSDPESSPVPEPAPASPPSVSSAP